MSKLCTITLILFCCHLLHAKEVSLGEYWKSVHPYAFDEKAVFNHVKQAMDDGKYQAQITIQKDNLPELLQFVGKHNLDGNVDAELITVTLLWNVKSVATYGIESIMPPHDEFKKVEYPNLVERIMSNNETKQRKATSKVIQLLSDGLKLSSPQARLLEKTLGIPEIIEAGLVPRFAEFLTFDQNPALQSNAAWILGSVAAGTPEQAMTVIHAGAVPTYIRLLNSSNDYIRDVAYWALGNIANHSFVFRDYVLQNGLMTPLLLQLSNETSQNSSQSVTARATWVLSNLLSGKPMPSLDLVVSALPTLTRLIHSDQDRVLIEALHAYYYLAEANNTSIQVVIDPEVTKRIVQLLTHTSHLVQHAALQTLGNLIGSPDQTQVIIDAGAMPTLTTLLQNPQKHVRQETCIAISKLAADKNNIQAIIDAQMIPSLIQLLVGDAKREAAWAVSNITLAATVEQIKFLVSEGCIKPLCDLLIHTDALDMIQVVLSSLETILSAGEQEPKNANGDNPFFRMMYDAGAQPKIMALQFFPDKYEKASKMWKMYFSNSF